MSGGAQAMKDLVPFHVLASLDGLFQNLIKLFHRSDPARWHGDQTFLQRRRRSLPAAADPPHFRRGGPLVELPVSYQAILEFRRLAAGTGIVAADLLLSGCRLQFPHLFRNAIRCWKKTPV